MNLHQQFVQLATQRNKITHELLALIPEIDQQRIWEKQGYQSIYHYAQAIAGLSFGVVQKRIRLEKHINDKPHLRAAIKTEGIHKVALVATLATSENEEELADFISNAGKSAIEEYSKELRANGPNKKCQAHQKMTIELDDEMQQMFLKLKRKYGDKISNKEALRRILREKAPIRKSVKKASPGMLLGKAESRHIPKAKQESLSDTCIYPGCNRPKEILHHQDRYGSSHSHDSVQPFCRNHHEFAHNGKIKNERKNPSEWQLTNVALRPEDIKYRRHRKEAVR